MTLRTLLATSTRRLCIHRIQKVIYRSKVSVAIVGSGPSGCYTAKYLKSALAETESSVLDIHIFDRLPTPYGLVRHGVAPDHPEVKNVQFDFDKLFENGNNIEFKGNVNVGHDVSLKELQDLYQVVVLAYGCESDRKLGIPREEELHGILSAREFVAWYNGHPDFGHVGAHVEQALKVGSSLSSSCHGNDVAVIGQGNVALDCARILAKGGCNLRDTDISSNALQILENGVEHTTVMGRRGHVQGAFTIKELRELTKLDSVSFVVRPDELEMGMTESSQQELDGPGGRPRTRINKLLHDVAGRDNSVEEERQIALRFLLNPIEFLPNENDSSTLGAVVCERTRLEGDAGKQVAVGTGEYETIPAQMALVSIGYKGIALAGMEHYFVSDRGTVRNDHGRISPGLYVSGWLKRGPSGIIGTNIADAKDTVATILQDLEKLPNETQSNDQIDDLLRDRGIQVIDWGGYENIDAVETEPTRKRSQEQPREKLTTINELLDAAAVSK